jgi:hypothetical protein
MLGTFGVLKRMRIIKFAVLSAAFALAACSDAASEAPVELKPGKYQIVIQGLNRIDGTKEHCVMPEEAARFPSDPVRLFLPTALRDSCDSQGDRKGNALTGTMTCKIQNADMRAEIDLNWTGRMQADNFDVAGDEVLKGVNGPEGGSAPMSKVTVTGKRISDCFS